jgi:hypothetical protein
LLLVNLFFKTTYRSAQVEDRRKTKLLAPLLAGLCLSPLAAHAQSGLWMPPSVSAPGDYNNPDNWSPAAPPSGPTGTATFDVALPKTVIFSQNTTVGQVRFLGPGYVFNLDKQLTITGPGIVGPAANAPTFNVIGNPANSTPSISFNNLSSAGTAQFILGQIVDTNQGFNAGFILFNGNSTAAQATITVRDASSTTFMNSSTAAQATLIVDNGGFVGFFDTSNGAQATIINNAGGEVRIADLTTGGTSFGSIAGAGRIQ